MKTMTAVVALAALLAAGRAGAEDFLKKGAPAAKVSAKAAVVGKLAPKEYQKAVLDQALAGIEERADVIAHYINDNGCRIDGGKRSAVTGADVVAKAKQIAPKIEVILLSYAEMKATFVSSSGVTPWAAGMCGEGRATRGFPLPGKSDADALVLRTEDGKPAPIAKLVDNMPSHTLSHELLHVLLSQFGNPKLGGGDAKPACTGDLKIANAHHRLTRHLLWGQYGGEWTPSDPPAACD